MADQRIGRAVLELAASGNGELLRVLDTIDQRTAGIGKSWKNTTKEAAGFNVEAKVMTGVMTALRAALPVVGIASMVAGLKSMAAGAFDAAGKVKDLSDKTGLSTDAIQRMQAVAKQTGTSVDAFAQSTFKLGVNIAEGSKKSRDAIRDLGLSYAELKAKKPEEQFAAVVRALEGVENQQERNRLGTALFGKQFTEIAAAIQSGYSDIADAASVSSQAQIDALDAAGDAWQKFKDDASTSLTSFLGNLVIATQNAKRNISTIANLPGGLNALFAAAMVPGGIPMLLGRAAQVDAPKPVASHGGPAPSPSPGLSNYVQLLREAQKEVAALSREQRDQLNAALKLGSKEAQDYAESIGLSDNALQLYTSSVRNAKSATEELAKAQRDHDNWLGERRMQDDAARMAAGWQETRSGFVPRPPVPPTFWRPPIAPLAQMPILQTTGWQPPFAPFAGTVGMNAPGHPGFFGNLFGNFKGGLSNMWQGMSGGGGMAGFMSNMGQGILSGGITSLMNMGISAAWNGLKKLFGSERRETQKKRNEWIESIGGVDELKKAAAEANVSLDKLFAARKVKDFENEVKRVTKAIEEHKAKMAKLEADILEKERERAELDRERADIEEQIKGLRSTDRMHELAEKFGIDEGGLSQGFKQGRANTGWQEIIDAISVFEQGAGGSENRGAALFGLRDEISALVRESERAKTTIPENMRAVIMHLLETGNLLDESGEAMKALPDIKFGEAIASQLEKAQDKLAGVLERLSEVLEKLADLNGQKASFTVEGQFTNTGVNGGAPAVFENEDRNEGYAAGTLGRHGSFFRDFGRRTATMLHGVEAVIRPNQALGFAQAVLAGGASDTPLLIQVDRDVLARAVIRRQGNQLSLMGGR